MRTRIAELLAARNPREALQEYQELLKINRVVYGETSLEMAKTHRALGYLQGENGLKAQAKHHLELASRLFTENLKKEQASDCLKKLEEIKRTVPRRRPIIHV